MVFQRQCGRVREGEEGMVGDAQDPQRVQCQAWERSQLSSPTFNHETGTVP